MKKPLYLWVITKPGDHFSRLFEDGSHALYLRTLFAVIGLVIQSVSTQNGSFEQT